MIRSLAAALLLVVGLLVAALVPAVAAESGGGRGRIQADAKVLAPGKAFGVVGSWSDNEAARHHAGIGVATNVEREEAFSDVCMVVVGVPSLRACDWRLGVQAPLLCPEGETPRSPRWTRFRVPPSEQWSEWQLQDYGACVGPGGPVPVLTAEEFRRLPLPAPVLHVQPDADWVLVNIQTIVYTDPTPVTLTTELFGVPVVVEAAPSRFAYDWGDGHATTTRDPGRPYPAFDVFHEYEQPGDVAITLTTEWTGRYQVGADPTWRDVAGTAETSTTSRTFEVQERTARLVPGTCFEEPDAPGCEGFDPRRGR